MVLPCVDYAVSAQQAFTLKWSRPTGLTFGTGIQPLAVDVNGDGIPEVFASGRGSTQDKVYCFNGRNGNTIWSKTLTYRIQPHCPMMIYNINGQFNLYQPGPNGMEVLNAANGNLVWRNGNIHCGEEYQCLVSDGHPYLFTCDGIADGSGVLNKIDASTGKILITKIIWHPCHGGLSAANVNNDGKCELFLSDRNTGPGKGITCYDSATLKILWSRPSIACSSFPPVVIDVNKDGKLDLVIPQRRDMDAGIYCLDARTGANIPGKYQDSIKGLGVHEAMPVYDIDGDGNLELATCCSTVVRVFDLGRWKFDATLAWDGKSPYFANVVGDSKLDIILSEGTSKILVYDSGYHLVATVPVTSCGSNVQDIDGDGLNELIVYGANGYVYAYDTLAHAASPLPRTNINNFSERNTRAAVYIPPPT